MLTVGAFSRASGLPVSALRYYDAAGVLRPAHVDAVTGYRWYARDQVVRARIVAGLRRTGMPVADICRAITADPVTARRIVDAHQRHLETELVEATTHLDDARDLLAATTTLTVNDTALRAALRSVRHAVADNPAWPALHGVLFDVDRAVLRLVATDRHRLAATGVPLEGVVGPPAQVIVPIAIVDAFLGHAVTAQVGVSLAAQRVTLGNLDGTPIDALYPDYHALLAAHQPKTWDMSTPDSLPDTDCATATAPNLLTQVTRREAGPGAHAGSRDRLILIGLDQTGVRIGDAPRSVAFDREYLTEAIRSFGDTDLQLTFGERNTLRLAARHAPDTVALIMPVRLDPRAA